MKKFVWILLVLCLALGCVVGYIAAKGGDKNSGEPVALYDPENVAEPEIIAGPETAEASPEEQSAGDEEPESRPLRFLDYDRLYALYAPDETVGTMDGAEMSWDEYFYWLHDVGTQAESYIQTLALYGQSLDWEDALSSDSDETLAQTVVLLASDSAKQLRVIETVAAENGAVLSPEDEAELAETMSAAILEFCGEDGTEEDFNALLAENYIPRSMYDRLSRANYLYGNLFTALYGENGADVAEADALAYLEENGYLSAAHILFMTIDPNTYEALDEAAIAEKLAQAEAVAAELRAIEDTDARAKRFAELKEQYCEDDGKAAYPDGYLFVSGTMEKAFENAVKEMEEYEVSDPVLTAWGYHVIMRLPLSAEMTMEYSDAGAARTARSVLAEERFETMMRERIEQGVLTLRDDVAALDLTQFLTEGE